ncbi:unnamed protein product [Coregonus sp. 'balchen']|nr:unnamed protein product [Coregonus sp. 'balchen']
MARIEPGNGLKSAESHKSLRSTRESLALTDGEGNSFSSDSELNGYTSERQTDKYGFIGGAQQYSEQSAENIPPEVLRQREAKWLDMLNNWDKWMAKRHKKMKLRCQKGIPPSLRGRAWLYLSGGKQDLYRVLKAYTLHRPEEGYCQAQAPIAAVLLMHMPAEDAFWGLVQICEKYLPGYYSAGLEAIQLDGEILSALLKRVSPLAHRHLKKHKMDPILYMTEWFMCAFSRTLPWASVLRVWDMFLCEGVKIIFRVGLVLLKCMLGSQDKLKTCQGQYETMELLKTIDTRYMQEGFLVREIIELPVSERNIEKEHLASVRRWKETRGELHCKSPPRMHGAKAIMAAEPPSHQDLRQNPTIIVESPLATKRNGEYKERKKTKEEKNGKKNHSPTPVAANPFPEPSEPSPLLKDTAMQGSNQSLSSTEHDTYL